MARGRAGAGGAFLGGLTAAVLLTVLGACTTDTPSTVPPTSVRPTTAAPAPGTSTTAPATSPTSTTPSLNAGTQTSVPPSPSGTATFFTPSGGFAMSGRIAVEQARQDSFSNLLQRGALHGQPITLDVVGTPDEPVSVAPGMTILFGTCKCSARGAGLRLTVEDAAAVTLQPNGDLAIRGTFRPVQTASDAVTLKTT